MFLFFTSKRKPLQAIMLICLMVFSNCHNMNSKNYPKVLIKTEMGNIKLELYADKAPITVQNFLRYINEKRLQGINFYRTVTTEPDNQPDKTVKIDVIQGGYAPHLLPQGTTIAQLLPPIAHESTDKTGIKHQDGTISMARDAPGTAQAEFFICIGTQPELDFGGKRNPDGAGFAAFGRVIEGMDIVHKIHAEPNENQVLDPRVDILSVEIIK